MNYRCQLCLSSLSLVLIQVRSSSLLLENYRKKICKIKEAFYLVFKELLLKNEGLFQDYTLNIYM